MSTIAVVGAGGAAGHALVDRLVSRGHRVLAATSRGEGGTSDTAGAETVRVEPGDVGTLRRVMRACDLVVTLLRDPGGRRAALEAAVAVGAHHLDGTLDQEEVAWTYHTASAAALEAGVVVVPAAGLAVGDLLAHLAAGAVTAPREVHVCWSVPGRGGVLAAASPGARAALADAIARPSRVLLDGRPAEEFVGEARRLAWFPRPVGPAHAAGVPGPEALSVPRHVPGVRTVRTYVAMASWRAELLQAASSLAREPRLRRRLERWVVGRRVAHSPQTRATMRWACVAESRGDEGVARAWAYGHDPQFLHVLTLEALVDAVLAGRADVGVVPPALVEVPGDLLDRLSARSDLRWSVARPS